MSIRIYLDKKILNKELNTQIDYEKCSELSEEGENKINTPRESYTKINDLSTKKILNKSTSRYSRNNPSTTDKLSNYSSNSYFVDKKISSEIEREYVIEECTEYKIRTPVKKESINSNTSSSLNHDINTNVGPYTSFIYDESRSFKEENYKKISLKNEDENDSKSNSYEKYVGLNNVRKNLNEDFNKSQIEFSTGSVSKQYIF